MVKLRWGAVS